MAEYIERKKAIKALIGWDTDPTDEEIEYTLKHIPAADVEPVKHGKWEMRYNKSSEEWYPHCSQCNTTWDAETNHCHNCGARMDGGKNVG